MRDSNAASGLRKAAGNGAGFADSLSHEAYANGFRIFNGISGEMPVMLRWMRDCLPGLLPVRDGLSVLSVGGGTGYFDFELIPILETRCRELRYQVLEPNPAHRKQFETGIVSEAFGKTRFEVLSVKFEDYSPAARFDLLHFTQCLYYLPDREGAIRRAMDMISEEGLILVFHQTPEGIHQIQRNFLKSAKGSAAEMFSSRDLREILDRRKIPYQAEFLDSFLDVTDYAVFDSEPGRDLLSFFLECDVRSLEKKFVREVSDFIRNISIFKDGRQLIYHPVAIFSIFNKINPE
ncbi:MAG TPA: methyltransferase domain-containing protein [Candidatus Omnitrophota bacterium]|nr:methyltransferase domain-containing protein [Candidatus Omnitrophota bacterium]